MPNKRGRSEIFVNFNKRGGGGMGFKMKRGFGISKNPLISAINEKKT